MRVWERGSGETIACGTGALLRSASCIGSKRILSTRVEDIRVLLAGGELIINYTDDRVLVTGGCVKVLLEGVIRNMKFLNYYKFIYA